MAAIWIIIIISVLFGPQTEIYLLYYLRRIKKPENSSIKEAGIRDFSFSFRKIT